MGEVGPIVDLRGACLCILATDSITCDENAMGTVLVIASPIALPDSTHFELGRTKCSDHSLFYECIHSLNCY
jgi:hypothetical protein